MRTLIACLSFLLSVTCFGQFGFDKNKVSAPVMTIVMKMAKVNELLAAVVNEGGVRPEQYDLFERLRLKATTNELAELTRHANGVVRCYAFLALSCDSSFNLIPITIEHFSDTAEITRQLGCIRGREKAGDFFVRVATEHYSSALPIQTAAPGLKQLDSLLIYSSNSLDSRSAAISRATLSNELYSRLQTILADEQEPAALIALAKFRKENDVPVILAFNSEAGSINRNYATYSAIIEFPHPSFLPFLSKNLTEALDDGSWSSEWTELYRTLASYKNDTALQLMKAALTQAAANDVRQYHGDFIFQAINEFYSSVYDDLLWQLWAEEKKLNVRTFRLLYHKDANRAFKLTKYTLDHLDNFSIPIPYSFDPDDNTTNLIQVMLDTLLVHDTPLTIQFIDRYIREIDVHRFPTFADKALELGDSSLITSLFARLETEDNPHIYLKAAEVLLAFHDPIISSQVMGMTKRNRSLTQSWGGKEFMKLLKESHSK